MTGRERASAAFGLRYNDLAGALAFALDVVLPLRPLKPFRHKCAPCDTCGSTGVVNVGDEVKGDEDGECPTCEGRSRPCHCEAAYDAEGDRRYREFKNGDHDD